jgi:hypothetical protein
MRTLLPIVIAAALATTPVFAAGQADTTVAPLPAGSAAGIDKAPVLGGATLWWIGGGVAVVAVAAIALSSHSSSTAKTTGH